MTMPDPAEWEQRVLDAYGFTRDELGELREKPPFAALPVDTSYGLMQVIKSPHRYEHDWDALADMAAGQDPRGPWIMSEFGGNCAMCGCHWEPGEEQIRYDPDAGGWVCLACGSGELE